MARDSTTPSIFQRGMLKRYDVGLAEYLTLYLEGQRVPTQFATPRREDLANTGTVQKGDFQPTEYERVDLPACTLTSYDKRFSIERWTPRKTRKIKYSDDANLVLGAKHPLPYDISYQFEIWTKWQHDMNELIEQYAAKWPQPVYAFDVKFPPAVPWGTRAIHMRNEGGFNSSAILEGGEIQRVLRYVASITVEGWIPLPGEWIRTVQKYGLQIIEENSEEILYSAETEYASKEEFWETGSNMQSLTWTDV